MSRTSIGWCVLALVALTLVACGEDAAEPGGPAGDVGVDVAADADAAVDTSTGEDTAAPDAQPDVPEGCPAARQCGETCCGAGQECVQGACADACPTQRCGAAEVCCTGGEVCHFDQCRAPGEACRVAEECDGASLCLDGYCYPTAGACAEREDCPARYACDPLSHQCFRPPSVCLATEQECGNLCCASYETCQREGGPSCVAAACADGQGRCGGACCDDARECVDNACVPRCESERCGPLELCCGVGEVCRANQCAPACETVSCGAAHTCCAEGDICYVDQCVTPGGGCTGSFDCVDGEYCDPGLGRCLPIVAIQTDCFFTPDGTFEPTVEWEWGQSAVMPQHVQVIMAPVVAQTNDDNHDGVIDERDVPDVIVNTYSGNNFSTDGVLRILSGADGTALVTIDAADSRVIGASSVAAGDIDGDGLPEIVTGRADAANGRFGVVVFELQDVATNVWVKKWEDFTIDPRWGGAALADFDGDGLGEVVVGNVVYNYDGTVRGVATGLGTGDNGVGPLSIVADVDLDGTPEVVTGGGVFEADGQEVLSWGGDGFVAIGDFLGTPRPQVVIVEAGTVTVRRTTNGSVVWRVNVPGPASFNRVGPPTVADFDGDSLPEVAVAGGGYYVILDTNGDILWQYATQDLSSNVTGSSVFDFDGDGVSEVVYNDECFIRVFDIRYPPTDPRSVRFQLPNTSCTAYEYPVVVDVDNDGNAELVTVRTNPETSEDCGVIRGRCLSNWPAFDASGIGAGVRVFGDANDNWVPTRRIWNQHSYHVTNINEDGSLPYPEAPSWTTFNSYRKNDQGDGVFNAPDLLVANLEVDNTPCPAGLTVRARVLNGGALGIREGLPISLYVRSVENPTWTLVQTLQTSQPLIPGQTEELLWTWPVTEAWWNQILDVRIVVDDSGEGHGIHSECREENNDAVQTAIDCREPS